MSRTAVLAAVAAAGATVAFVRDGGAVRRRLPGRKVSLDPVRRACVAKAGTASWLLTLALVGVVWAGLGDATLAIAAGGFGLVLVVRWLVRGRRAQRRGDRNRRVVIGLCDALAAESRAGVPLTVALERTCRGVAELEPIAAAVRLGADPARAFGERSRQPGLEGLRAVAAAWEVAATAGSGMASVLDRVVESLRSAEEARDEMRAGLAPARATARLLAGLPAVGLALGSSLGADPVRFLATTTPGLWCLAVGVLLALGGVCWVERLANTVESEG